MSITPVAPTAPVTVPQAPRGVTETERAAAAMTPKTRELLPDTLLDAGVGKSTLAGALNDQIRFRVDRAPDLADWKFVPDSPAAHAVLQSQAGASLQQQFSTAVRSMRDMDATSNLKGFILPKDTEGVIAGYVLSTIDSKGDEDGERLKQFGVSGDTKAAAAMMRDIGDGLDASIKRAGAWNADGWITFLPDYARGMLIPGGGYKPHASEPRLNNADGMATYLAGNTTHEVQHSVSQPTPTAYRGAAKWMEEGTANVFARTKVFHQENSARSGMTPDAYNAGLKQQPSFDPGWGPWKRPEQKVDPNPPKGDDAARNYGKSQLVLRDLVRLAGADFRSTAGQNKAFDLLQSKSMRYTPGLLAKGIIEHQGLDPQVYDRLRTQISTAVDLPGGAKDLVDMFGLTDLPSRWESAPKRA